VGANYRAAQRARSDREFVSKIGVVIEESDESPYWLELNEVSQFSVGSGLQALLQEACELRDLRRFTAYRSKESRGEGRSPVT
jgi:four helix bundle protein